jgi:hypothetical protein
MPYKTKEARRKHAQTHAEVYEKQKAYKAKHRAKIAAYHKEYSKKWYAENSDEIKAASKRYREENKRKPRYIKMRLLNSAKWRASKNNVPFNLSLDDFEIPSQCPVYNVPFDSGIYAVTLDRIIPVLGYVKGNVQVISHRANTPKRDASLEELKTLVAFLEKNNT